MRLVATAQALSLDVVAGGVAGGALAVHLTGARPPLAWWFVLAGGIWVVYTLDHLVDAWRAGPGARNDRHRFHARHAGTLVVVVLAMGVVVGATALRVLPLPVLVVGLVLSGLILGHLGAVAAARSFPKEASVAIAYTAGIWLGPVAMAPRSQGWTWVAIGAHLLTAYAYLLMYAYFERDVDAADRSASVAQSLGPARLARVLGLLIALVAVTCLAGVLAGPAEARTGFTALLGAALAPALVMARAAWFGAHGRYRYAELALCVLAMPYVLR